VLYAVDDTKPDDSCPAIMGFILADRAIGLSSLSVEERKQALANHYAECFRCPEMKRPINYVEKNWCEEEYSGGCYVSNFPPGTLTSFGPVLREPFGNVYFAGTETATYWAGYMDGAIQAGERAAREILHARGKITADQIWVEEPPAPNYPEKDFDHMFIEKVLPSVQTFLKFVCTSAVVVISWALYRYLNN